MDDPKGWPLVTVMVIREEEKARVLLLDCGHEFRAHKARTDIQVGNRCGCFDCLKARRTPETAPV